MVGVYCIIIHHTVHSASPLGLCKLPTSGLDAVHHVLERLLRLGRHIGHRLRRRVVFFVAPLNLKGLQFELLVQAVNVLGSVAGEAADL